MLRPSKGSSRQTPQWVEVAESDLGMAVGMMIEAAYGEDFENECNAGRKGACNSGNMAASAQSGRMLHHEGRFWQAETRGRVSAAPLFSERLHIKAYAVVPGLLEMIDSGVTGLAGVSV